MFKPFYNTFSLLRLKLKNERIKIIAYIVLISGFLIAMVPIFDQILKETINQKVLVETMNNPAMISMIGPVYVKDYYTTGSMYANYMTVFVGIMFAAWNILFVTKQTRYEEEMGISELVKSQPVGKYSDLTSTLISSLMVNVIVLILLIIGFIITMPDEKILSIINFSSSTVGFGFLFSAITLLFAQISSSSRITNTLSFLSLSIFYIMRAIGDVSVEALSLLSPLGLIYRTESFIKDYNWPIIVLFFEIIIFLILSTILAKDRDLNSGKIKEAKGRNRLSSLIKGINSFNFKLQKSQIIIWTLVIIIFSAMYGSILGDLEGYIESSDLIRQMLTVNEGFSLTDQFIGLLMLIMSIITAIPVLIFFNNIRLEENKGHSEVVLTKPASRFRYLLSFIILSTIIALIYQILMAITTYSVGRQFLDEIPSLKVFIISALNYIPAILLTLSFGVLIIGIAPKFYWFSYLYLGYSFFIVYIGRILDLPETLEKLSPFAILPNYPLEDLSIKSIVILVILSVVFILSGIKGYKNRDLL